MFSETAEVGRSLLPLYILLVATPLGVTMQALGSGLALLLMVRICTKTRGAERWRELTKERWVSLGATFAFVVWMSIGTWLNPNNPSPRIWTYELGYLGW